MRREGTGDATPHRHIHSFFTKSITNKAKHRREFDESVSILQHALPQDIAMNNALPLLELPSYTIGGKIRLYEGERKLHHYQGKVIIILV